MILVSACLCGVNCKYNGKNNYCQKVVDLKEKYNLITICPEVDGGLPIPRIPSEIVNDNQELAFEFLTHEYFNKVDILKYDVVANIFPENLYNFLPIFEVLSIY